MANVYNDKQEDRQYITRWETSQLSVASSISEVMLRMYAPEVLDHQRFEDAIRELHEALLKALENDFTVATEDLTPSQSWPLPRWQLCHQSFVQAELLLSCHKLATKVDNFCKTSTKSAAKASKAMSGQTKALRDFAATTCKELKVQAAKWKKAVLERSQDEHLAEIALDMNGKTDDMIGKAIEQTMGTRNAKRIVQSFASSLMVALDGILKVDVA